MERNSSIRYCDSISLVLLGQLAFVEVEGGAAATSTHSVGTVHHLELAANKLGCVINVGFSQNLQRALVNENSSAVLLEHTVHLKIDVLHVGQLQLVLEAMASTGLHLNSESQQRVLVVLGNGVESGGRSVGHKQTQESSLVVLLGVHNGDGIFLDFLSGTDSGNSKRRRADAVKCLCVSSDGEPSRGQSATSSWLVTVV